MPETVRNAVTVLLEGDPDRHQQHGWDLTHWSAIEQDLVCEYCLHLLVSLLDFARDRCPCYFCPTHRFVVDLEEARHLRVHSLYPRHCAQPASSLDWVAGDCDAVPGWSAGDKRPVAIRYKEKCRRLEKVVER